MLVYYILFCVLNTAYIYIFFFLQNLYVSSNLNMAITNVSHVSSVTFLLQIRARSLQLTVMVILY